MRSFLLAFTWLLVSATAWSNVKDIRVWQSPDTTRLVLDLTRAVDHRIFTLGNPDRVVVDLTGAQVLVNTSKVKLKKTAVADIRTGKPKANTSRIVLDLKESLTPKAFALPPNKQYPHHRLVIDLRRKGPPKTAVSKPKASVQVIKKADALANNDRNIIVAIDAGHGGEDPGAIGPKKTREKIVVLAIAKELEKLLAAEPGFTPYMVRTGDYYIGLQERTQKARQANADIFVSLHADSFPHPSARGSSVYVLSDRGASSETARWLADNENQADLVGGVHLQDKDDHVRMTLLDLSMTYKRTSSKQAGTDILGYMGKISRLHKKQVEEAAFVVLKAPDIPALLVETGFISNPKEERNLASKKYQKQMAAAIHKGIRQYFIKHPPEGTLLASQQAKLAKMTSYTVRNGDTLSGIANRTGVTLSKLRQANRLTNDRIRVGQTLKIPSS